MNHNHHILSYIQYHFLFHIKYFSVDHILSPSTFSHINIHLRILIFHHNHILFLFHVFLHWHNTPQNLLHLHYHILLYIHFHFLFYILNHNQCQMIIHSIFFHSNIHLQISNFRLWNILSLYRFFHHLHTLHQKLN